MSYFGELLRESRIKSNKTQREVAKSVGISVPYLSDLENGKRAAPKGKLLFEFCGGLDIKPEDAVMALANDGATVVLSPLVAADKKLCGELGWLLYLESLNEATNPLPQTTLLP